MKETHNVKPQGVCHLREIDNYRQLRLRYTLRTQEGHHLLLGREREYKWGARSEITREWRIQLIVYSTEKVSK